MIMAKSSSQNKFDILKNQSELVERMVLILEKYENGMVF